LTGIDLLAIPGQGPFIASGPIIAQGPIMAAMAGVGGTYLADKN